MHHYLERFSASEIDCRRFSDELVIEWDSSLIEFKATLLASISFAILMLIFPNR